MKNKDPYDAFGLAFGISMVAVLMFLAGILVSAFFYG